MAVIEESNVNENLIEDLPPWDRGRLLAHQISAGPTDNMERSLEQAKRQRRSILLWILPGRRRYLDGLISGLETNLEQRLRDRGRGGKRHGRGKASDRG